VGTSRDLKKLKAFVIGPLYPLEHASLSHV